MLFSSVSFLYYFLPVVLALYFLAPARFKNLVLLLASFAFYFWGEPIYSFLMAFSIVSAYLHGLWISKATSAKARKLALISSIVISISTLGFFKYWAFFINNINAVFNSTLDPLNLALPIGISFYTFQILSYTIDLYRGTVSVQRSLLNFATYVALFPQLIAGPIVRYSTVEEALSSRKHSLADIAYGINRFISGLAKKVIIANSLGELGVIFAAANEKTVLLYWIWAVSFTLQIYFDFSGYSDMAIGLGRIFGFHFPENFNFPYIAKSVTEFWRRWHISLGSWFRDYVYIPLGGNRVSLLKWIRNVAVVWFLTGFWHGAEWNFIIWGLYFAIFLVLEKFILNRLFSRLPGFFSHVYLLLAVIIGFVIFNTSGVTESITSLKAMFGMAGIPFTNLETGYYLASYRLIFVIAIFFSTPAWKWITQKIKSVKPLATVSGVLKPAVHVFLLLLITGYLVDGSFNPFIYFRF
jgi:alginate O-acetyltransferase complex protein AlgI